MAVVEFKDLCIDAADPVVLGKFWAAGLGLTFHRQRGGDTYLTGPTAQHTIWVNRVAEPKTVKHRLHLDINTRTVAEWIALGAVVVDDESFLWTLMSDPEGGEFCLFTRDEITSHRLHALVVDCASPDEAASTAKWWAEAFDANLVHDERGFSSVTDIAHAPFGSLDFIPVPEPKSVKNRLHIDVSAHNLHLVLAHGARVLRPADNDVSWTVCADPGGNEFCVFASA